MEAEAAGIERPIGREITDFESIVKQHQKRVYALCLRMAGNHADADCLTQEAFMKAYKNMGRFRGNADMGTWLWRIAYNTCIDFAKESSRHRDTLNAVQNRVETAHGEDASVGAELGERRDAVWQTLGQLDPEDRAVITLTVMEGVSHKEAGEILGMPAGTVSWRVAETKKVLARKLSRYIQEEDK